MRHKTIRVRDLTDQIDSTLRAFLFCPVCQGEYSAHRGDYFMASPETVMKCCDTPMVRVVRHTTLEEV
jgi:hypothetical protein